MRPSPVAQSVTWPSHLMLDGPTQSAPPSHPRNRRVSAISRTPSTSSRRTTSPRARREVGGAAPQVVHLDTGKLGGSSASVPPSPLPKPPCPSPPHPSPLCHSSRRPPPRSSLSLLHSLPLHTFQNPAHATPHTSLTTSLVSSLHHSLLTTAAPAPSMPSPPLAPPLWPPATSCQQGSSWSHRCYCWMQMELMMA